VMVMLDKVFVLQQRAGDAGERLEGRGCLEVERWHVDRWEFGVAGISVVEVG
jgi:hypothetical protein